MYIFDLGQVSAIRSHIHAHKWCLDASHPLTTYLCAICNLVRGGIWQLRLCNNELCWIFVFVLQFIGYVSPHNVTTVHHSHLTVTHIHSPQSHITCNQWLLSLILLETVVWQRCSHNFGVKIYRTTQITHIDANVTAHTLTHDYTYHITVNQWIISVLTSWFTRCSHV